MADECTLIVDLPIFVLLQPVWMDLGPDPEVYLARIAWTTVGGGDKMPLLFVQTENRAQTQLDLLQLNPTSGVR